MAFTTLDDAKFAASIINDGISRLGYGTANYIDTGDSATTETIEAGMKAIGSLPADVVNPLLNQIDIILVYRNYATMFDSSKNPTRRFWRDAINFGGGIEDIYQEILEPLNPVMGTWAQDYADGDPDGSLALNNAKYHFGYHSGAVQKKFHTSKKKLDFAISLSEHEISKIFTPEGFMGYVNVRLANIQYSAEIQLQNAVIENIKRMVENSAIVYSENENINTMNGVTNFVENVKMTTMGMKQPSTAFNKANIITMSDEDDLYLVTTPDVLARVGTRGAENAYNLQEYMYKNRTIILPFGSDLGTSPITGQKVYAVLVDRRAIVMALRYWSMKPFIPTGSDYQNYFLKIEFVDGYNEFFNAVAFTGEAVEDFFTPSEKSGTLTVLTTSYGTVNSLNVEGDENGGTLNSIVVMPSTSSFFDSSTSLYNSFLNVKSFSINAPALTIYHNGVFAGMTRDNKTISIDSVDGDYLIICSESTEFGGQLPYTPIQNYALA